MLIPRDVALGVEEGLEALVPLGVALVLEEGEECALDCAFLVALRVGLLCDSLIFGPFFFFCFSKVFA